MVLFYYIDSKVNVLIPKTEFKKITKLYLLSAIALIAIFVAGIYTGEILFPEKEIEVVSEEKLEAISLEPTKLAVYEPKVKGIFTGPSSDYKDEDRLLFISNEEVWTVKLDKTQRIKLTKDGVTDQIRYVAVDWQFPGIASYVKCASQCYVVTQDIASSSENVLFEIPKSVLSVEELVWSPDGKQVALIIFNNDDTREVLLINEQNQTSLVKFKQASTRGSELRDKLNIEFSSDGNYMIVNNTFNYPENPDQPTVIVFDKEGKEVSRLSSETTLISNATFYNNYEFVYLSGKEFRKAAIDSSSSEKIYELDEAYDLAGQNNKIAFWSFKVSGDPVVVLMDETNFVRHLSREYGNPVWTNNETGLVAIEKQLSPLNDIYIDARLALIDIETGQVSILVDEHIIDFSLE